ncbi:glycosyltransferase [Cellulomonas alba]|uniref:Glycosyltransferase n=1 Tax=Cellulomonas alba TaxID=3053467 RepID=A0ABT7SJ71_9CELL|nr:glycosyltransferase [Cellulomonas alba]MDM7856228.1 glycosyltransferase [Cellulomonas alba]
MTQPTSDAARGPRAFVSFVDDAYFPGFVVLLKSLTLTNPDLDADFVVLHDGLDPAHVSRALALRPDLRFVRVDAARYERYVKGDASNYLYTKAYFILDAFRLTGYRTLVTLDTDMVVLDRLDELFELDAPLAAVPQLFDADGGRKLNSGLLVIDGSLTDGTFADGLDAIGESGAYELDRHDQGVLTAALDGDYVRLPRRFNWVKRATKRGDAAPADVAILHFTGKFKPWDGGEHGYRLLEDRWDAYDLPDADFLAAVGDLAEQGHLASTARATYYKERARQLRDGAGHAGAPSPELAARGEDVLPAAQRLREAGDFAGAAQLLERRALEHGRLDADYALALAQAYVAVSRYDDARVLATTAVTGPRAADAHLLLAEIAWTVNDLETARAQARETLALDPLRHKARLVHARAGRPRADAGVDSPTDPGGVPLAHAAFYVDDLGNYGDLLLPVAVRAAVSHVRAVSSWEGLHVHQVLDDDAVERVNQTRGLLVGGGGLFLPDTAPNGNSGWQWNVPDASLDRLDVPLGLVAVGYNVFEGQRFVGSRFRESLVGVVERAAFVGLRNHGSIERVRDLLPPSLADRVTYLPCPTTVLGLLGDPRFADPMTPEPAPRADAPVVYLNVAYDRSALRFKDDYPRFLREIDRFVRAVEGRAHVRVAAHTIPDERIAIDLYREHGTRVPVDSFFRLGIETTTALLRAAALVIGMRGHAGMIPIGLGTPIVSLVSHPKLQYFLDDVRHPEWGVRVDDRDLGRRLTELTTDVLDRPDAYRRDVHAVRESLLAATLDTLGPFVASM